MEEAIRDPHNSELDGRKISVKEAIPQDQIPPGDYCFCVSPDEQGLGGGSHMTAAAVCMPLDGQIQRDLHHSIGGGEHNSELDGRKISVKEAILQDQIPPGT
jgi:hypothetical protein